VGLPADRVGKNEVDADGGKGARTISKSGAEKSNFSTGARGTLSNSATSASGLWYGSAGSRTPLTMVNTAVFAPMPTANASTATMVKPGLDEARRRVS
jgi:hypothetical protein